MRRRNGVDADRTGGLLVLLQLDRRCCFLGRVKELGVECCSSAMAMLF